MSVTLLEAALASSELDPSELLLSFSEPSVGAERQIDPFGSDAEVLASAPSESGVIACSVVGHTLADWPALVRQMTVTQIQRTTGPDAFAGVCLEQPHVNNLGIVGLSELQPGTPMGEYLMKLAPQAASAISLLHQAILAASQLPETRGWWKDVFGFGVWSLGDVLSMASKMPVKSGGAANQYLMSLGNLLGDQPQLGAYRI